MGPNTADSRRELEARVLAAALKQSFERGDMTGALLAHRQLTELLRQKAEGNEGQVPSVQDMVASPGPSPPNLPPEPAPDPKPAPASDAPQFSAAVDPPPPVMPAGTPTADADPPPSAPQAAEPAAPEDPAPPGGQAAYAADSHPSPVSQTGKNGGEPDALSLDVQSPAASPPAVAPTLSTAPARGEDKPPQEGYGTFYDVLQANPMSSREDIHVRFLRVVRELLNHQNTHKQLTSREFRERLRTICVAHDILHDPSTRTDYDFRLMGLRGEKGTTAVQTPEDEKPAGVTTRSTLRIGELLQVAEILEPTELEIAVDMHKAMREYPFGQFLVKQGFLSEAELNSALFGQQLIGDGKITVAQFQVAMYSMRETSIPLPETLVMRGWISQDDADHLSLPDPGPKMVQLHEIGEVPPGPAVHDVPVVAHDQTQPRLAQISKASAVPSWAEQIDWTEETAGEEVVAEPAAAAGETPPVESGELETAEPPAFAAETLAREAEPADEPLEPVSEINREDIVIGVPQVEALEDDLAQKEEEEEEEQEEEQGVESEVEIEPPLEAEQVEATIEVEAEAATLLAGEGAGDDVAEGTSEALSTEQLALLDQAMAALESVDQFFVQPEPREPESPPPTEAAGYGDVSEAADEEAPPEFEPISRRLKHDQAGKPPGESEEKTGQLASERKDLARDPVVMSLQEQLAGLKARRDAIQQGLADAREDESPSGDTDLRPIVGALESEALSPGTEYATSDDDAESPARNDEEPFTAALEEDDSAGKGKGSQAPAGRRSTTRGRKKVESADLDQDVE